MGNTNRLNDQHLKRLTKLLAIKTAQRCNKLTKKRRRNILLPIIKQISKYRADVYNDNEQEVTKELMYLCGLIK